MEDDMKSNLLRLLLGWALLTTVLFAVTSAQSFRDLTWTMNVVTKPIPHRGFACATNGDYIYLLGGSISIYSSGVIDSVYCSKIGTDGQLGEWVSATPLPAKLWEAEAFVFGMYVYLIGGQSTDATWRAHIDPNGGLGNWEPQTPLPQPLYGHTTVLVGSRIYVMGGWYTPMCTFATIDSVRGLGRWTLTTPLPVNLYASDACLIGNRIYVFGGKQIVNDAQTIVSNVRSAAILSSGHLDDWVESDSMPSARWFHQVECNQCTVFVVGGGLTGIDDPFVHQGIVNERGRISWSQVGRAPVSSNGGGLVRIDTLLYYIAGAWSNAIFITRPGPLDGIEDQGELPSACSLLQNYPNPFNPTTMIRYHVSGVSHVRVAMYNLLGCEVAVLVNEKKATGNYEVQLDATGLASGAYFCRLQVGTISKTISMLLLK
jgi:hypothetical protein